MFKKLKLWKNVFFKKFESFWKIWIFRKIKNFLKICFFLKMFIFCMSDFFGKILILKNYQMLKDQENSMNACQKVSNSQK